jgi:hypothetical protein
MNETRRRLLVIFAWLQLVASVAFAVVLLWGYVTFQSSLAQIVQSIVASFGAVSNTVARTAETVEGRRELFNQSAQMLAETRKLIRELVVVTEDQARLAPQTAASLKAAASIAGKLSGLAQAVSDQMMFSAPSGIRWEGMRPVVVMSRPLEASAGNIRTIAQEIKTVSEGMASIATSIGRDGQNLGGAVVASGNQALKVIAEAEKTLERINAQDLPKAIEELKATSQNLNVVSAQVDMLGKGGVVLLVAGLILAVWCFLNSLGFLMLANANRPLPKQGNLVNS